MPEVGPGTPVRPPARVAFLGLGKMGQPMARRLREAGFSVRGFDLSEDTRRAFAQGGGAAAASAREAVADAQVVITMLPDGKAVRAALLGGEPPLVEGLAEGTIVIDMSSSSPIDTQALGRDLAPFGLGLVDAPVSGGVKKAVSGELAIMAGSDDPALPGRVRPVLEAMGASIFETGPLGSGHAMKALNNYVSAAGLMAACEALRVGKGFGLDPELMVDVLNASSGRNNSTEVKMKPFVISGRYDSGFALALMAKDLRTADDLARHLGVPARLSHVCADMWAEALEQLGPGADHTAIDLYVAAPSKDGRK